MLIPEVVRHPHFEVPYPQLKRGQQSLGALVAVVRPFRYIYRQSPIFSLATNTQLSSLNANITI